MLEIRNKCPPYFVQAEVRKLLMYLTVSKRLISFISFIPSQPVSICHFEFLFQFTSLTLLTYYVIKDKFLLRLDWNKITRKPPWPPNISRNLKQYNTCNQRLWAVFLQQP